MPLLDDPTADTIVSADQTPAAVRATGLLDDPTASSSLGGPTGAVSPLGPSTWADVPRQLESGAYGVGANLTGVLASRGRTPEETAYWRAQTEAMQRGQQEAVGQETLAAQQAREGSFFAHPVLQTAEQIPGLAALAVPSVAAGATLGPLAGAAMAAGLMGEQSRGEIYNRLAGQGVTPTPGQLAGAEALGAATGLATEVIGPLAGKIATGPLARAALGVGGDMVTFGAGAAGQEYTGQTAEIAAGKRPTLDPAAIVEAGRGGAEFGGLLGAGRLLHREQPGGETVSTRSRRDYRKPEVTQQGGKPPAPGPSAETPTGPPPPDNPVTDTIAAGLKGALPEPTPAEPPAAKPAEPPPAPTPPVAKAPEAIVPETEAVLRQQHADLTDPTNPRIAMVYNPDMQAYPVPAQLKPGKFATGVLDDGRIIQYDKTKTSRAKIDTADKARQLNTILELGPVSKDEAVQRAVAGERPAVVTERTPEGLTTKAAAGTTATAPAQTEALEASKTPGSTIQVEPPERVVAERQAAPPETIPTTPPVIARPEIARPETTPPEIARPEITPPAITPRVTEPTPPTGRVLPAVQTEAERTALGEAQRQMARTVQERLKAMEKERLAAEAAERGETTGKHWTATEKQAISDRNALANEVAAQHAPQGGETREAIWNRAKAMVDEAKARKLTIPTESASHHSPGLAVLMEARDLTKKKVPTVTDLGTFIDREGMLRQGKLEDMRAVRRAEGAEAFAMGTREAEKTSEVAGDAGGQAPEESGAETAQERVPAQRAARQVVTLKSRMIRRQALEGERPGAVLASDRANNPIEITPTRTTTAREAIAEHFDPKRYSPEFRQMMERLRDAVVRIAGDTPVHYVSHDDMTRMAGPAMGMYHLAHDQIYINNEHLIHDTALHEAFHAATAKALAASPRLQDLMTRLRDDIGVYSDPEEFLTRLMTDPTIQKFFKGRRISPELANDIGIPKWRKATMWEGALSIIRQALGLGPRDTSAIEAAMAITEHAMWSRDPGMAMEAAGRMAERDLGARRYQMMDDARDAVVKAAGKLDRDVWARHAKDMGTDVGAKLTKGMAKIGSITQLDRVYGKISPHLRAVGQARDREHHAYITGRDEDKDLRTKAYILDSQPGPHAQSYDRLTRISTAHDIDASKPPPKPTGKDEHVQRDQFWPEAHDLYNSMPEAWRQRYRDENDQYREWQQARGEQALKDLVTAVGPPDGSTFEAVVKRAKADDLTEEDKEHFEQAKVLDKVNRAIGQIAKKDTYFARDRGGDWVVNGEYDMPDGGSKTDHSGSELPEDTREFETQAEAHAYARDDNTRGLQATIRKAYYGVDPKTGVLGRVTKDEAEHQAPRGQKAEPFYQVRLERQHMETVASPSEGRRMKAEMERLGAKNVSEPLDKRQDATWAHISPADQRLLESRFKKSGASEVEQKRMIEASREAMLASRAGSLLAKHQIQRRNVLGGTSGSASALDTYSRAHHYAMARAQVGPELEAAMDAMDAHERANRTDADATKRSIVNNEIRDRVYKTTTPMKAQTSALMRNLMNYSFLNFLLRPAHVFLQQMHPWVYSVPELMARHGFKAINGQRQAMRDLAGGRGFGNWRMIGKGAAAGYRMATTGTKDLDKAVAAAQGWDATREMIGNLKDKQERDAMTALWQTGHLHSGFDQQIFEGNGLDRAQAVLGQLTNAMEATNRLSTALNAYRLERAAHGDPGNAIEYARRRIETSHGVYTPTNVAPVFKNPLLKPVMQFHQMPLNLAIHLYNNMGQAAKGDIEARRTLAYQLGTAFAFGGMGGMPMDVPKLAGLASQALGSNSPSDYDDKFRRFLADHFGQTAANAIEDGLPTLAGGFAPVLGHRMGFDSGLLFGEPKSGGVADINAFLASNVGASWSTITDALDGLHQLEAGDYQKAMEKALPGSLRDLAKAYREATVGVTTPKGQQVHPASVAAGFIQALGFQPEEMARAQAGRIALSKAIKQRGMDKTSIIQGVVSGDMTQGDVAKWNAANPKDRISPGEIKSARKPRKTTLGVPVSKRDKDLTEEYGRVYQ